MSTSRNKRRKLSTSQLQRGSASPDGEVSWSEYGPEWEDWPAPRAQMEIARDFIRDIVELKRSVLLAPDKDADGLSAGTIMYKCLTMMGLPSDKIHVHHLSKGTNVHTDQERAIMESYSADRLIVLDQGSRPGPELVTTKEGESNSLIIDHHISWEFPEKATILTACHSPPIATAALLTYLLVRPLHPQTREKLGWRALIGVFGDLGPKEAQWGRKPWPSDLGDVLKQVGSKSVSDAVAAINAPRRTAEYNVPRAWEIYLNASRPSDIASHAYLKLCKIDVAEETEKWARTAPKFALDGRVAVITIDTAFQVHPVIATRWAGNLGRKSKKLVMVMCANIGYHSDPDIVSFSCRIASGLRSLPESERPSLIDLLEEYGSQIEGFRARVGPNFAKGHKEATGGIIAKMGVVERIKSEPNSPNKLRKASPRRIDGIRPITSFFPVKSVKPDIQ